MTTAEKYYAFLDLAYPTNPILSARLATCLPADLVESRWRAFSERRIWTRLSATSDLTIADAGSSQLDVACAEVPITEWPAEVAREADTAYGLDRTVALRYLSDPDAGESLMFFVGPHSVVDGRGGLTELQAFLRYVDGQDVPEQDVLSEPAGHAGFDWQSDRRAMLDLLRDLSSRNRDLGDPLPGSWPDASLPRASRLTPITFSPEAATTILSTAREEGVRVFSAMSAAWIGEVARTVFETDEGVVQLNVPVDRSVPSDDPRRPTASAVGVLSHRYRLRTGEQWPLARDIAATVERALGRGEGELFFQLARLDAITDLEAGAAAVRTAIEGAAPAVSVTNMGLLDATGDPEWVRAMWGNLAATPNQVISFSTVGYRGQLCSTLWTDDARVSPAQAGELADGFRKALA